MNCTIYQDVSFQSCKTPTACNQQKQIKMLRYQKLKVRPSCLPKVITMYVNERSREKAKAIVTLQQDNSVIDQLVILNKVTFKMCCM